uniref:Uncharacterized protein n=1 Tax=uncultured Armatimonadetes bacterium TaxID=157466 RepID=A0A6J4JW71_9BACT|nr:hypothetical protein AVDCRST_MAG63-4184 [uncultured Armatimonadetes bacterium]
MKLTPIAVWLPFAFAVALSAISLVTWSALPNSGAWIPAFICFLPMTFFFAANAHLQTRAYAQALEARVRQMEEERDVSVGSAPAP